MDVSCSSFFAHLQENFAIRVPETEAFLCFVRLVWAVNSFHQAKTYGWDIFP